MKKERLEAYSDAIIAIIITLMVLEIHAPEHQFSWSALLPLSRIFLVYAFSFIMIGIYWNNHYHLFKDVKQVSSKILWLNNLSLFVITLFPFITSWLSEGYQHQAPVMLYTIVLLLSNITHYILAAALKQEFPQRKPEIESQQKSSVQMMILLVLAIIVGIWSPILELVIAVIGIIIFWGIQTFFHRRKQA